MVGKVKRLKKITDCLLSVAFYICILIIGWLVLQTTCFTTFTIPSDSMAPTLQAGDRILVNKWIMGARMTWIWMITRRAMRLGKYMSPFYGNSRAPDPLVNSIRLVL